MMEYENMATKVGDKITIEINKSTAGDRYEKPESSPVIVIRLDII
jgi:hypothetical protein